MFVLGNSFTITINSEELLIIIRSIVKPEGDQTAAVDNVEISS